MEEKIEGLTKEERRKARQRAYYQANRDKIRQQQREYYRSIDKAKHAARIRKYRQEHYERNLEVQREYRKNNRERIRELDRRYRERHHEQIKEAKRQYWNEHREELIQKKRAYNAAHRKEQRTYYQKNRYRLCQQKLEVYTVNSIRRIGVDCPDRVAQYMNIWPYEEWVEQLIRRQLSRWGIPKHHHLYADCYDAGMLAYLYTIHRCALMGYRHVVPYLIKMIRVLTICALVVGRETENICQTNYLRPYRLDQGMREE